MDRPTERQRVESHRFRSYEMKRERRSKKKREKERKKERGRAWVNEGKEPHDNIVCVIPRESQERKVVAGFPEPGDENKTRATRARFFRSLFPSTIFLPF